MKTDESVIDFPKDGLCPEIWDKVIAVDGINETWTLKPEVEKKLLSIVRMACEEAKVQFALDQVQVNITGSITSNSYTENADIDVHLHLMYTIRELAEVTQERFNEAFKKVRQHYASEGLEGDEGMSVSGHPIELYY